MFAKPLKEGEEGPSHDKCVKFAEAELLNFLFLHGFYSTLTLCGTRRQEKKGKEINASFSNCMKALLMKIKTIKTKVKIKQYRNEY